MKQLEKYINRFSPWVRLLLVVSGIVFFFSLPFDNLSRRTYISENALLPGQVNTYFGDVDKKVFNAYREDLLSSTHEDYRGRILDSFGHLGIRAAEYKNNVYALLRAPRGDATEVLVLSSSYINRNSDVNINGIAMLLSLARYFKKWSLWSKDILLLIPFDSYESNVNFLNAYLGQDDSIPFRSSGLIQAAIDIEFTSNHTRYHSLTVQYEGLNGLLPNLDLVNTAQLIAENYYGIPVHIQQISPRSDTYKDRLNHVWRALLTQAQGTPQGAHVPFLANNIDAISIIVNSSEDGYHDPVGFGRIVESIFRSLNNLLEKFHQSFFFYILVAPRRFISIANYLPAAILISAAYTVTALTMFYQVLYSDKPSPSASEHLISASIVVTIYLGSLLSFLGLTKLQERQFDYLWTMPLLLKAIVFTIPAFPRMIPQLSKQIRPRLLKMYANAILGPVLAMLSALSFFLAFPLALATSPAIFACHFGDAIRGMLFLMTIALQLSGILRYVGEAIIVRQIESWLVYKSWTPFAIWGLYVPTLIVCYAILTIEDNPETEKVIVVDDTKIKIIDSD